MKTMKQWASVLMLAAGVARGGTLVPSDPPGPTMHTLEELWQALQTTQAELQAARQNVQSNAQRLASLETRLETAGLGTVPAGMALIPAGRFVMGATTNVGHEFMLDEIPQRVLMVSAVYMDMHEVTLNQWDVLYDWADEHGYVFSSGCARGKPGGGDEHPVQTVNWFDCVKWCNARSEQAGLAACYTVSGEVYRVGEQVPDCDLHARGYRLPTEAEWEKAARGGLANRRFPWGDSSTIQHARANYNSMQLPIYAYDTSPTTACHPDYDNDPEPYTSPVGMFAPNGYGLYDMAGNVGEWCWDWYLSDYSALQEQTTDPLGAELGYSRVVRGGAWNLVSGGSRVANRQSFEPSTRNNYVGFRCVLPVRQ